MADLESAPMPNSIDHLVWFRRDLRLGDNPAWAAATKQADQVTALFVLDPALFDRAGTFRQQALVAHLRCLDAQLRERGGRLRIEHGDPAVVVPSIMNTLAADRVHWNTDTTPYAVPRDTNVAAALGDRVQTHWGTFVHEPGRVLTGRGTLSKVFTPFYNVWNKTEMTAWVTGEGDATVADEAGAGLPQLGSAQEHAAGEHAARERLHNFLGRIDDYLDTRDLPAVDGTSQLSGDLRFGTLSPREIAAVVGETTNGRRGFVRQLAWRDWYAHLLFQNPTMPSAAIKPEYDAVVWRNDADDFQAWKDGTTGYPIVDAGMRQLLHTGWMHNRVRMIVGSFLVKDLLVDWRKGERWFRHLLVDADMSQNVGNWQWVAGCGTDAAPYFRVFNPWTQSRKFDTAGDYIRQWVPELAGLDKKMIHEPHLAPPLDLAAAGVVLGDTYPHPIVDHAFARDRVLTAYKTALGKT
ncbi:MAG: deoxyribodipyrimidine photo-lyase [Acidimicrobiales bacterium]